MRPAPEARASRVRLRPARHRIAGATVTLTLTLAACGGGSGSLPVDGGDAPGEIVFGRSNVDSSHSNTRLYRSTARGLGERGLAERSGIESGVRVHPDGNRLVYARERRNAEPDSREIFTSTIDGSEAEFRVTGDNAIDGSPCWSADGERILFVSDRGGQGPRLWTIRPDGSELRLFHDGGFDAAAPDWSYASDRVVFAQTEPSAPGRTRLWTIDAAGRMASPLTELGTALADEAPSWSPDGTRVAFRRRLDPARSVLATVAVGTGIVEPVTTVDGDVTLPRWTPDGGRILCALALPADGIVPGRLTLVDVDDGAFRMLQLDKRFALTGIDVLPAFPEPLAGTPTTEDAPVEDAELVSGFGRISRGFLELIQERDDAVFGIATEPFGGREIASAQLRVPTRLVDVARLQDVIVEIVAGVPDPGIDDVLRVSVSNFVTSREDTIVERTPSGALEVITFRFGSLAHVDRDGRVAFSIIADRDPDQPGELRIDHVAIRTVETRPPE